MLLACLTAGIFLIIIVTDTTHLLSLSVKGLINVKGECYGRQ